MLDAGDIVSRLLLDMSDFNKAMKSAPGIAKKDLDKVNKKMKTTMVQMNKSVQGFVDKSEKHGKRFEEGWWKRFGAVALGFTVAYRAMNAFERGLQKLSETIIEAIRESGELASIQAKMALWTTMHSKGIIKYGDSFQYARGTMLALMDASVTSLSAISELATGLDEMGQTLGLVRTETVKSAVDLIDFTVLVAQTTGSVTRQVRQEIQSLLQGQIRTTDIVIRTMRKMGVVTDEDIAKLKKQIDVQETFDKVLLAISAHMEEFREQVLRTDVSKALAYWEKSIRVVLVRSTLLASTLEGVGNIYAEELTKRAKEYGDALSDIEIERSIILMLRLRDAFALGLDLFEKMTGIAGSLATAITNLDDELRLAAKGLGYLLLAGAATKSLELLGKTAIWLYSMPLKLLTIAFTSLYLRIMLIPVAAAAAAVALETLGDTFPNTYAKIMDGLEGLLMFYQDKLSFIPKGLIPGIEAAINDLEEDLSGLQDRFGFMPKALADGIGAALRDLSEDLATVRDTINDPKIGKGLEELGEKVKGLAEETYDYWKDPAIEFGATYKKNVLKHTKELANALKPLWGDIKGFIEDTFTPDLGVDFYGLLALANEELENIGLNTQDQKKHAEGVNKEAENYLKRMKKINQEYRITDALLTALKEGRLDLEDLEFRKKGLKIQDEYLQAALQEDTVLARIVKRYTDRAWALHMLQGRLREYIENMKEREKTMQKYIQLAKDASAAEYWMEEPPFDWEQWILPTGISKKVEEISVEQLTAVRNMYEDMNAYGEKYYEAQIALINIQAKEYLKALKDTANKEIIVKKWIANETEKLEEKKKEMILSSLSSAMSNYASLFEYLSKENRKYFMLFKAAAIAAAIIDAFRAAGQAMAHLPPPWSYVAATAAYAAGMARVAAIKAQTYAIGGWLKDHPKGGPIKEGSGSRDDVFLGSTPGVNHIGMRDEFVFVMNKEATKKYGTALEAMNQGMAGGGWINRGYGGLGEVLTSIPSAITSGWGGSGEEFESLAEQTKALREEFREFTKELADLVLDLSSAFSEAAIIFRKSFEAAVPGGVMFGEYFETPDLDINIEPMQANAEAIRIEMERLAAEFGWTAEELERQIQAEIARQQALFDTTASVQEVIALEQALAEQEATLAAASQAALQEVFDTLIVGSEEFGMLSQDVQEAITDMVASGEEDVAALLAYWTDLTSTIDDVESGIADMLDELTPFEQKLVDTKKQFDDWIADLMRLGATQDYLNDIYNQKQDVLDYIIAQEEERLAIEREKIKLLNEQLVQDLRVRHLQLKGYSDLAEMMSLTIKQEEELANAIEQGATDSTINFMEAIHALEVEALKAEQAVEANTVALAEFKEEANRLESVLSSWESALRSVQDQILSITTSMATSPLDAVERLGLIWDAINNFGDISTPEAVSELQGLYNEMLSVAAEAYQRPSIEYQKEYAAALAGLGGLEDIADDIMSEYELQKKQLEVLIAIHDIEEDSLNALLFPVWTPPTEGPITEGDIDAPPSTGIGVPIDGSDMFPIWTPPVVGGPITSGDIDAIPGVGVGVPSYQRGTNYVPETGIYQLHQGERVLRADESNDATSFILNLAINESKTPRETGIAVRKEFENFLRSNVGRALIQKTAKGRG